MMLLVRGDRANMVEVLVPRHQVAVGTATAITSDGNRNPANADLGGSHESGRIDDFTAHACLDPANAQRNGAAGRIAETEFPNGTHSPGHPGSSMCRYRYAACSRGTSDVEPQRPAAGGAQVPGLVEVLMGIAVRADSHDLAVGRLEFEGNRVSVDRQPQGAPGQPPMPAMHESTGGCGVLVLCPARARPPRTYPRCRGTPKPPPRKIRHRCSPTRIVSRNRRTVPHASWIEPLTRHVRAARSWMTIVAVQ
jgi:hypothetical protein